jgi:predicted RNA methylase
MGSRIPVKTVKIDPAALNIISGMEWAESGGQVVGKLTCGQLDRKMYEAVNKGLDLLGGKWNKKTGGHVFAIDPRQQVAEMLGTGTVTVEKDGFFRTPRAIVLQMLDMLRNPSGVVLEPSAGDGAICDVLKAEGYTIHAVERNELRRNILHDKGYKVDPCTDFLDMCGNFQTIVMNPPFENMQDVDHIVHAFNNCLVDGGQLVSVVSESPFFRETAKAEAFRQMIDACGYSVELPEGAFRESGTMVKCRLVYLRK